MKSTSTNSSKYQFVEIEVSRGDRGRITWFTDAEIEAELRRTDGSQISLEQASLLYFANAMDKDGILIPEVCQLGILEYAHSRGFRVDLLASMEFAISC